MVIRWVGGNHTRLEVRKNRAAQHRWSTDVDVVELVRVLARQMPDKAIASLLNRVGKTTGRGNGWTPPRSSPAPRLWLDNIWRARVPPAPRPLGSGQRNDRRRRWRMTLARNRWFADSLLEEAVTSEPVSAGKFPASWVKTRNFTDRGLSGIAEGRKEAETSDR